MICDSLTASLNSVRLLLCYNKIAMTRFILILFLILTQLLLAFDYAFAAAAVTAATGGSAISADTAGGSYTALTGPVISEGVTADIGIGTIILNVPSGFIFDTGGTAPTVLVTRIAGSGPNTRNINNVASGTSLAITSITTAQITFTVTDFTSNGVRNSLTWQNVRVRPSAGAPLASGNITKSGTSSIVGVNGTTNFGTLTETAGAKNQLVYTTQPSSSATVATDFATKPVIAVRDQFGNTVTSDSSTTITRTVVLSTQTCGGTSGTGTLTSTPASGAAVTAGVMTYTAMQYSVGESIKICASSSGVTSALSDTITVNNPVPTTTSISPTSKTAGDSGFTLTVNGTNFVSSSVVRFNGSSRTTTFVSSTQLTAAILTGDLTTAGTFSITVFNTTPGGGTSNTQTFTVNAAADTTAPAAVSNLALSNPTTSSLDLAWTAPGDDNNSGTAATYDIRYSTANITDGNFSSATQVTGEPAPQVAGTSQSMTVTGLSANTTYYFAMKTSDEAPNTSALSNVPSLATSAAADTTAPAAISNLTASNPTTSSIDLAWTAPGDDNNSGTAATYDIRYSTANITDGNFSSATQVTGEPAPQVAGTSQSMTVTGLSANTTYYFAMKTSDEAPNTSALSNVPSAATLESADTTAPAAITDLVASDATVSSIKLTWNSPGDDDNMGTATSYDIRYSTLPITESNFSAVTQLAGEPSPAAAGASQNVTVTGLAQDTTYYFAMKTSDEAPNISALSNVVSLATLSEIISPVIIPERDGQVVFPTSVSFSGRAYPGGRVKFFRRSMIDIRETNTYVLDTETTADSSGRFEKKFQALLQGAYFFAVEARDRDNRSSGILSFTVNLISNNKLNADNIFVAPTVDFDPSTATKGNDVKVFGYASPDSLVEIELDKILRYNARSNQQGYYSIAVNTSRFSPKEHFLKAWQVDALGNQSPVSPIKTFKITLLSNPKADFNNDNIINIVDWSIFLFRWRSQDVNLKKLSDLDTNNKVDIVDLSIFLKAIKG